MWWLFEKIAETASSAIYKYAREAYECSGKIEFDKKNSSVVSFEPCEKDHTEFDRNVAISKFTFFVAGEGFPDRRRVVCG